MGRAPAVPRVAGAAASNGNQRRPRAVGRRRWSSRMCSSGRRTRGRRTREGAKANARESVLRFSWPIRIVAAKWPHRHRSPDPPGRYTAGTRSGRQTTQQRSVVPWGGGRCSPRQAPPCTVSVVISPRRARSKFAMAVERVAALAAVVLLLPLVRCSSTICATDGARECAGHEPLNPNVACIGPAHKKRPTARPLPTDANCKMA